jgi:hypothetical protein
MISEAVNGQTMTLPEADIQTAAGTATWLPQYPHFHAFDTSSL